MFAWLMLLLCVVSSTGADTVSTQYWKTRQPLWAAAVVVLGPISYFCFGYVGNRFGLSIASSLMNSFIALASVLVGLIFFMEWKKMPWPVYVGMTMIIIGMVIVALYRPRE